MEAILLSPNQDHQSISRNRSSKNCNYRGGGFISRSSENFTPPSNIHGGVAGGFLFGPSSPYSSFPSSLSILGHHQPQQQPPLLPLPVPTRNYSSFPAVAAARNNKPILQIISSTSSNNNRKNKNRTREQDLTPKKPKSSINRISRPDSRSKTIMNKSRGTTPLISSTNRLGPEPRDIPKEVSGVLKPVVTLSEVEMEVEMEVVEKEKEKEEELSVSGSIFSLAPPPSSLPLPKFSVTPKLRCNVEAGGIDAGATDNLRRLLRLR